MRTFGKKQTSPADSEGRASSPAERSAGQENWFRKNWCVLTLIAIVVVAFLLRFCFSYGISAGDNYALSGGTSAASHRRIIVEILFGTYNPGNEAVLNYPYGAESISGPLFDYCCAAWAKLFSAFGMSYDASAGAALAWNPPIFGALTCIPVYMLATKIYKGDKIIGLTAAGFYCCFPVLIMTTPFSYGTELPFLCFLVAGLTYFVVSAFSAIDELGVTGIKQVFTTKAIVQWVLLAALFMAGIVLTWTGFWAIMMTAAIMLFFALLFARLAGRPMAAIVGVTSAVLLAGVVAGACYYIPYGMWDLVFSGGCIVGVLAVAYSILFLVLEKKPWVLSIPLTCVVILAVAVVLYFVAPELSDAALSGNDVYTGALMSALVTETSRTSVSAMASYYGWLTLWFPLFLGVWMFYKYRENYKSNVYTFTMLWLLACYCVGWYNSEYAVLAGAGFAVGCAALIVLVFRAVNLLAYFRSLRGNGAKAGAKKALNFFPLVTVLVAVCLVAVPTAVYAADAATPTNDDGDSGYFGGLGYTVNTSDSSLINSAWSNADSYTHGDKTLLTWYGYSDAATSAGGFSSVTSSTGGGTSAMASTYFATSGSAAIASMLVRLIETDPSAYQATLATALGDDALAAEFVSYVSSESKAREYMSNAENSSKFEGYNASPEAESLSYIVGSKFLESNFGESTIAEAYEAVCAQSGKSINYIEVDAGMIPLYYGDGSYASSAAYFGDYKLDKYNAPSKFYTVSSTTEYYYQWGYYDRLYYDYNEALYDTFFWNAVMGVTPETYGLTSGISLLSALASSDGSVKATPAAGMGHFKIAYWHVNYKASENADWVEKDIDTALALQNTDGGYINYLSSVIVLEYVKNSDLAIQHCTVTSGGEPIPNAKVAVFEKLKAGDIGYDPSGAVTYVQRSTTYAIEGTCDVVVPASGDFLVRYYIGSEHMRDGTLLDTKTACENLDFAQVGITATLVNTEGDLIKNSACSISFTGSDGKVTTVSDPDGNGVFDEASLVPDKYTVSVYSAEGTLLNSVELFAVETSGVSISAATSTLEVKIVDMFGNACDATAEIKSAGTVIATGVSNGNPIPVVAGTYTIDIIGPDYMAATQSITIDAKSSSAKTANITAYTAALAGSEAGQYATGIGYSDLLGNYKTVPLIAKDYIAAYSAGGSITKTGTVKSGSNGVQATIAFVKGDYAYVFGTESNGHFEVTLDAEPDFVYAYDSKGNAFIGAFAEEITLGTAYNVTFYAKYTSLIDGDRNIAYVPVTLNVKIGDETPVVLHPITGSNGSVVVHVPAGAKIWYSVSEDVFNSAYDGVFHFKDDADWTDGTDSGEHAKTVNSAMSATLRFDGKGEDTVNHINAIDPPVFQNTDGHPLPAAVYYFKASSSSGQSFYYDGTDYYTDASDPTGSAINKLVPGKYTVTVHDGSAYVDSKTVTLYPTTKSTEVFEIEALQTFKITLTTPTSNKVSVVCIPDADGNTGKIFDKTESGSADRVFYVEYNSAFKYYVLVTDSKAQNIFYSEVINGDSADTPIAPVDLLAKKTLKGYVGSSIDGTLLVSFGTNNQVLVDVKGGEYSVDLPVGDGSTPVSVTSMVLDASKDSGNYSYISNCELLAASIDVSDDMTQNFGAETVKDATGAIVITAANMNYATGIGEVTVTITDGDGTYYVNGTNGFTLMKTYSSNCPATGSIDIVVQGYFNSESVGAGDSKIAVVVSKLGGSSSTTLVVPAEFTYASNPSELSVSVASAVGSEVKDAMNGFGYMYAIAFKNSAAESQCIKFNQADSLATITESDKWVLAFVDEGGYLVNAEEYYVNGYSTTTLYAMLINKTGDSTAIPAMTVKFSGGDYTADVELTGPQTGTVSVDSASASGEGIDNSKSTIPTGFWILLVFAILLFLITIWGAMKRGVFSRRN